MKIRLVSMAFVAGLLAVWCAAPAMADTITQGGISYTLTAGEVDGGGVFDAVLVIDTTGATSSGTLSSFAVQFTGATLVTLETFPAGWSVLGTGPSSSNGCQLNPGNAWCLGGPGITVPGGVYTFVFDVTMPVGTPLPTDSHIQAFQGQGGLAISEGLGIGTGGNGTSVPEPGSMGLLSTGLLGLVGLGFARRRELSS
jgi:PEP-CTERM motif